MVPSRRLRASRSPCGQEQEPLFSEQTCCKVGAATTLGVGTMFKPRASVVASLSAAVVAVAAASLPGAERGQEAGQAAPTGRNTAANVAKDELARELALKTPRLDQFDKYYALSIK